MADNKQPFSRLRSWLAPTRKTPATRSTQLAASSTPTTTPPNTSSPAARQARPSDKTRTTPNQSTSTLRKPASTGAQRTSSRPPGRATQTSNPQPQASKTGSHLPSQARATAQSPVGQKASQSSVSTQSQTNPQPSATSTSLATTQSQADPQPSPPVGQQTSPSAATTQSQANPQPSTTSPPLGQQTSPSAATTQSQANLQSSTTSPSAATTQSQANPHPSTTSPSAATTQSQANPQSSTTSPSTATTQSQANPHPSTTSPSAATTQPQANPQSSTTSPSAATTQSQANPQPSTTSPPVDQQTSPSVATTESQANPQHSTTSPPVDRQTSPSAATTQALAHPPPSTISGRVPPPKVVKHHSTRKKTSQAVTHDSSQLPPTSMEAPTSAFHKEEPLLASNSHNQGLGETNIQHNEKTTQSKEPSLVTARMSTREGGPETTIPAQRSKFSNMNNQTDPNAESYLKPEVTKEVAEIVQETKDKDLEEPSQEVNAVQSFGSGTTEQIKEQQSDAVQSEQMLMDRQEDIGIKKMVAMSTRNGKQNKATTPQSRNTNVIGDSHQPPATFRGEDIPFHKEIKDNISKFLRRKTSGDARFPTDERQISVITLAGENRGASMQLGSESSNKGRTLHIHRGYKLNRNENTEATTDGETRSKQTESKDQKTIEEDQAAETCINNNLQGINNSILFNCSITERNPGVHLVQIRTSTKSIKPSDRKEALETHKAEFNMTPAQKLTYEQPTVRRRCLRGLFLESSDSDPENPEKPRRHGCRVGCIEKYQSNSVDIL